jgi:hypothetical protein
MHPARQPRACVSADDFARPSGATGATGATGVTGVIGVTGVTGVKSLLASGNQR